MFTNCVIIRLRGTQARDNFDFLLLPISELCILRTRFNKFSGFSCSLIECLYVETVFEEIQVDILLRGVTFDLLESFLTNF